MIKLGNIFFKMGTFLASECQGGALPPPETVRGGRLPPCPPPVTALVLKIRPAYMKEPTLLKTCEGILAGDVGEFPLYLSQIPPRCTTQKGVAIKKIFELRAEIHRECSLGW